MNNYIIRQIKTEEYETVRQLDSDAFRYNESGDDGDFHRIFADNIRKSPYFIPKLIWLQLRMKVLFLDTAFSQHCQWVMQQIMLCGSIALP